MNAGAASTEIKILGKSYAIRSEFDSAFMSETAGMVDGMMRDLMDKAGAIPTEKVAILTAMNLAGELLKRKKDDKALRESLRQKSRKLLALIDAQL